MALAAFLALTSAQSFGFQPVLWLNLGGAVLLNGRPVPMRSTAGVQRVPIPGGFAFDFDGQRGGLRLEDFEPLRLVGSMTISAWVYLRAYVNHGPGAQILFRGDDRRGLDAYTMAVHPNGTLHFGITDPANEARSVGGEVPLRRWMRIVAAFDGQKGRLDLWIDGKNVAHGETDRRPMVSLDPASAPGIGVGNVQNEAGPHNQPLDGMIADLRLYDAALTPDQIPSRSW